MRLHPRFEPALWAGLAAPLLSLLVALQWHGLSQDQATLILAAIAAAGGVVTAIATRPIAPAAFTAAVTALFALFAGFHFSVRPDIIAGVNGLILAGLAVWTRMQVTPTASAGAAVSGRH